MAHYKGVPMHYYPASGVGASKGWRNLPKRDLVEALGYWLLSCEEVLGWYLEAVYTGHSLRKKEGHWLLVVNATIDGDKRVAFFSAEAPLECLLSFGWHISHNSVTWTADLY